MRFRNGDEIVVAIGWVGICCADDPAAEIVLGSRSEAMPRSLVACIEEVSDIGRVVGNQRNISGLLFRLLSTEASGDPCDCRWETIRRPPKPCLTIYIATNCRPSDPAKPH